MSKVVDRVQLPVVSSTMETHDNTMFSDWARCPYLYWIRHRLGKTPRVVRPPLTFGQLIHDGLAEYYIKLSAGEAVRQSLAAALQVMYEKPYADPPGGYRTKGKALLAMEAYSNHWKDDPDLEILFTEMPFNIKDANGFPYGGRLDLIVRYRPDGNIYPLDHKTSSYFGNTYFDDFKSSPQMAGYSWATEQFVGERPRGVIINNLTIRKNGSNEFHRLPIPYGDHLIDEWYEDTIHRYQEVQHAIENDYFERRRFNCRDKWGKCDAWDVCHGQPQNTMRNIRVLFEDGKWDWNNPDAKV